METSPAARHSSIISLHQDFPPERALNSAPSPPAPPLQPLEMEPRAREYEPSGSPRDLQGKVPYWCSQGGAFPEGAGPSRGAGLPRGRGLPEGRGFPGGAGEGATPSGHVPGTEARDFRSLLVIPGKRRRPARCHPPWHSFMVS